MITQLHQFNGIDRTVQLQHHFTSITIYSKFNYNTTSIQLQYIHNMTDSTSSIPVPDVSSHHPWHEHSYSFLNHPHGTWSQYWTLITTWISYNTLGQLSVTIRSAACPALCTVHTNVVEVFQVAWASMVTPCCNWSTLCCNCKNKFKG